MEKLQKQRSLSKECIFTILTEYDNRNPHEKILDRTKSLEDSHDSLISRKNFPGHVTVSTMVLDQTLSKILLVQHKNLHKDIQPGGHIDETDETLCQAAQRELKEETGFTTARMISICEECPDIPLDIDIHSIPENQKKREPEHAHIDFRYVFVLDDDGQGKINEEEIGGIVWKPLEEFKHATSDLSRVVQKITNIISERRDDLFFEKVARMFSLDLTDVNIVMVLHIVPDILPFIKTVSTLARKVVIISKPNSISSGVLAQIRKELLCSFSREQLQDESTLQELFPKNERSYILDIGGYFANKTFLEFNNREKRVFGIVEDTENGHQKYEQLGKLSLPIISVARSDLKQNEDDLVGYSVAFYTEWVIRKFRHIPRYLACGIIGYGRLGKGVAKYLSNQNIKPLVYDTDPIRMVEAYKDGCLPATKEAILSHSGLIFGATGNKSIDDSEFSMIRPGCYIASVTSSDDEFNLSGITERFNTVYESEFVHKYADERTHWYLINNGNAVNFIDRDGDRVSNFIRLVQAEILCSFQSLAREKLPHGLQEITQDKKKEIARTFINYYTLH